MSQFTQEFQDRFISGQVTDEEILVAMADCIRLKQHYGARGYFRRLAYTLIEAGYITEEGIIQQEGGSMPVSKYNSAFGGKKGSAEKALESMKKEYGEKKGTAVFYATKNKRSKKGK